MAHQSGVAVEGELGSPAEATASGVDHSHASLTDPDEAARFVEETGVDCLAVSVGNVHIMMEQEASIDMERLRSIHERVDVPLVIHGGTSFPAAAVAPAIALGRREVQCRHGAQARVLGWTGIRGPLCRYSSRCAQAPRFPQGRRCDAHRPGADDRQGSLADQAVRGERALGRSRRRLAAR